MIDEKLIERIKSTRNRCDVVLVLSEMKDTGHLVQTILEDLCGAVQVITEEHCIEEKND